jgi:hypothetical protein
LAQVENDQILDVLGSGVFAVVFRARHCVTMVVVTLKVIQKRKLWAMHEFELLQCEETPSVAPAARYHEVDANHVACTKKVKIKSVFPKGHVLRRLLIVLKWMRITARVRGRCVVCRSGCLSSCAASGL